MNAQSESFNTARPISPAFVSGYGQSDTHAAILNDGRPNPHKSAGTPYSTITAREIVAMVQTPPSVPKERARWFIPSAYHGSNARTQEVQRERGLFHWLTLDVDDNDLSLAEVSEAVEAVTGACTRLIYSSRSAMADRRKWRALVPLLAPLGGADFTDAQHAFYDLLERESAGVLVPDRRLALPAQLVYLPNRGEFYEHQIVKADRLDLTEDHPIMRRMAENRAARAQAEAEAEAQARRQYRIATRPAPSGDDVLPVDHFNAAHSVGDLLVRYGYRQLGHSADWRSPMQTSGSYATRDCGDYWVSLSASDAAAGIGAVSANGNRHGDAFDLFVHFEHGGDFNAAVAAYAQEAGLNRRPDTRSTAGNAQTEAAQESTRSFDELMTAARLLSADQIEDMEAIVSEAAALPPMRRDSILRAIKDATGTPLGTLRSQMAQDREGTELDDLALARLALDQIGRDNIIHADAFTWMWLDRGVWAQQDERAVKQAVQRTIEGAETEVSAALVNAVSDVLKTEIFRPVHTFNLGNPEAVNCLNGEIERINGRWTLRPHCREHYRTTQIPVAYDPQADAPMFRQFLGQVFRDDADRDDKIAAVLELIGYTLMSHARHEKFVMLIGPGANGKSVLLSLLERLLGGENVAGVQPANFDRSFQRAHLHQKLANIVTELKQGEIIADAELKAITSGEPSTVEHKFQHPFVMRPFATCWFGTNHMPHTRDFSEALFRRATILQFNRVFAEHEQDPLLKDKLASELSGVLNLALEAYGRALGRGFTEPASSAEAKSEWRLEADQVAQFVDDACQRDPQARVIAGDVFRAYQAWATANGIAKTMSQKGLRERLTRLGFGHDRDRQARYVTGLRVITAAWGI